MAINQSSGKNMEFSKYFKSNLDFKAFAANLKKKKNQKNTLFSIPWKSLLTLFTFLPLPLKIQEVKSL